jgi:prepilin-type N-terminal cleavage/methylation domain-containing protein
MKKLNIKGFTIVEFIIVIIIIGLLAAMVIPAVQKVRESERNRTQVEQSKVEDPSFIIIKSINVKGNVFSVVKHKETGILYISNVNVFAPLVDKDGKPLIKY